MPVTDVDVSNDALDALGVSYKIEDLSEDSEQAAACAHHLPDARDAVLGEYDWGCARTFAELVEVEVSDGSQPWYDQWTYAYRYPDDCIVFRRLLTGLNYREHTPEPYVIGHDDDGKLVFCNLPAARAEYTRRVEDMDKIDAEIRRCIALHLADRIAETISHDKDKRADARRLYLAALVGAITLKGNEQARAKAPEGRYRRQRR